MQNSLHISFGEQGITRQCPRFFLSLVTIALMILSSVSPARAGSASWTPSPINDNWNSSFNWTPATVPNGPSDTATFGASSITNVLLSSATSLNGVAFNPGASSYFIRVAAQARLFISGTGVVNNSGTIQNFVTDTDGNFNQGDITFVGNASAGDATYTNFGAFNSGAFGGHVDFFNSASAGQGNFVIGGGAADGADGASILFFDVSTAADGTFNINGGSTNGASNGDVEFIHHSTAGNATLKADGGFDGGEGATIFFFDDSTGGTAKAIVASNGSLDISTHNAPGISLGSIEGDGLVFLGSNNLTLGTDSDKTFGGVIADGGFNNGVGGSLTKAGTGTLSLTNASTYTGGTTLTRGKLLATNLVGSATGAGPVLVYAATLGGTGRIGGTVTVGSGRSRGGAVLFPATEAGDPGVLTLLSSLTFASDGFYMSLSRLEI